MLVLKNHAFEVPFVHPRFSPAPRRCAARQRQKDIAMPLISRVTATAVASLLLIGSAFAQATAPAAKGGPAEKKAVVHTAASLECSKEADAKGLHGKERKKFRSDCRREAGKAK
jgi:psiF repeat